MEAELERTRTEADANTVTLEKTMALERACAEADEVKLHIQPFNGII